MNKNLRGYLLTTAAYLLFIFGYDYLVKTHGDLPFFYSFLPIIGFTVAYFRKEKKRKEEEQVSSPAHKEE